MALGPGADEIAKRLERMLPPEARDEEGQLDPAIQEQIQQMGEAIQVLGQKLQEAEGKRDIDMQKLDVERYKAETERMTAMAPSFAPEQIQAVVMQVLADLASPNLPNAEVAQSGPGAFAQPEIGQAA